MDRSLWRLLGELWLLGYKGPDIDDGFLRLLEKTCARNLILFRDNLPEGPSSLPGVRKRLEEAAGGDMTLFVDEEGGWIQQFEARPWPAPRAQAMHGIEAVEVCHRALGARARELGAQVVCGPLADLDDGAANPVIGSRSFGDAPDSADAIVAALRGLLAGGVLPVLKHFPGHGDAGEDSHFTLPLVSADRSAAMRPFRAGVEAGGEAVALMTAHLRLDDHVAALPATYRPDIIRELLPGETGFEGLVITDALEMEGAALLPPASRGGRALAAGCHLLTLARWTPGAELMLEGMAAEILSGELREAWLDEARERRRRYLAAMPATEDAVLRGEPSGKIPKETPDQLPEELRAEIASAAVFRPGGGAVERLWDGAEIAVAFGSTGSWSRDEFLAALSGLPWRPLPEAFSAGADAADAVRFEPVEPAEPAEIITSAVAAEPAESASPSAASEPAVFPAPAVILRVGRDRPSAGFLAGLDALHAAGAAPLVLCLGAWGWTLPYPRRLAGADTSPPGLRAFLERIRRSG